MEREESSPLSGGRQESMGAEDERLVQEAAAVLNQLRAYLRQTLDERSFTALLADLTHLRIRLERVRSTPDGVARALRALDAGLEEALRQLHGGADSSS